MRLKIHTATVAELLIARRGYEIGEMHLKGGKCSYCGAAVPGIWKKA